MRVHSAVLVLALVPLAGCLVDRTTVNRPLPREAVAALEPGRTTAAEVVASLGAPTEVVQLGRRSAYRFEFSTSKRAVLFLILVGLVNRDTRADRVWVFFDEGDVLTHVATTFEGDRTEYAMPWEELHD